MLKHYHYKIDKKKTRWDEPSRNSNQTKYNYIYPTLSRKAVLKIDDAVIVNLKQSVKKLDNIIKNKKVKSSSNR